MHKIILQLQKEKLNYNKASKTVLYISDTYEDQQSLDFIQTIRNKLAPHTKHTADQPIFRSVSFSSATLYIAQNKNTHTRQIFLPIKKYENRTMEEWKENFAQMLKLCLYSSMLMSQHISGSLKVVFCSLIDGKQFDIIQAINQAVSFFKNNFNLTNSQVNTEISLVFSTPKKSGEFKIKNKKTIKHSLGLSIFLLTNDDHNSSLYEVNEDYENLTAFSIDDFWKRKNIDITNVQKLFNYNRLNHILEESKQFIPQMKDKKKWQETKEITNQIQKLDLTTIEQLFQIFNDILFDPLTAVVSYCQNNADSNKPSLEQLNKCAANLAIFNTKYGFKEWEKSKQNKHSPVIKDQQMEVIQAKTQFLNKYSQKFLQFEKFQNEDINFIYAVVCDHINLIQKDYENLSKDIRMASKLIDRLRVQRNLKQFYKIILSLLANLKKSKSFSNFLADFQHGFYESLIQTFIGQYELLTCVFEKSYQKMNDFGSKIGKLVTPKEMLLKVISKVQGFKKSQKDNGQVKDMLIKQQMLQTLLRLFQQNKPEQKNIQLTAKVFCFKYDLAKTSSIIYIEKDSLSQGPAKFKRQNQALNILLNTYVFIFTNPQIKEQLSDKLNFTEFEILEDIAGILKAINRLDLSIQIQKKLNLELKVQKQYNRWICMYSRYDDELINIIKQAIDYFKIKCSQEKVKYYYDLLYQNTKDQKKKQSIEEEKYQYSKKLRDNQQFDRMIKKAKDLRQFNISEATVDKIKKVFMK